VTDEVEHYVQCPACGGWFDCRRRTPARGRFLQECMKTAMFEANAADGLCAAVEHVPVETVRIARGRCGEA
jgi:hypothetical protein